MALRSRPAKVFYVECDRCPAQGPQGFMPVEAELAAGDLGWYVSDDQQGHLCPRHAPREAPVETPLGEQIDQGFEVELGGF